VSRCRRLLTAVLLAASLAGCTEVTDGVGGAARSTPAPGGVAPPTECPHVDYPAARLRFDCITTGLSAVRNGPVWPFSESRVVEPSTGWFLEQGAGHWGSPEGVALVDIALDVRQQMIDAESYGVAPTVRTDASRAAEVDGRPAYVLRTTFVINPEWARGEGTAVEQERLWVLAIEVAPNDVSLWYVSLPDIVRALWSKVPAAMASIKVG
jgi:hypothetical protein